MSKTQIRGNQILDHSITQIDVNFSGSTLLNNITTGDTLLIVDGVDTDSGVKRIGISPISQSLRSNNNITNGGSIMINNYSGSNYVYWTNVFRVISNGRGYNFSTTGYFDIACPISGIIQGVGGASSVSATSHGIPLLGWQVLYYELPISSGSTSLPGNFKIASYSSDIDIPHNWVQICAANNTNGVFYFPQGVKLKSGESINLSNYDAINSDKIDGWHLSDITGHTYSNYINVTGDTMSGMLTLNNGLDLNGYVSLHGDETGLVLRNHDNSDFGDITAKKFIKNGGTGDQYLMADGTVITTGSTTSYYDSRYVNVTGDTIFVNTGRTISATNGLTGGGNLSSNITISHADTSSITGHSSELLDGYVFQMIDIDVDTYGHVTSIWTGVSNFDERYSQLNHFHYQLFNPTGGTSTVYVDNGGNLHIDADIFQNGSGYTTHAEQIYTTKDYIFLRSGSTAGLSTGQYTGFEAIKYDGVNNGRLVFDNTGTARVGDVGSEQPLATRNESTAMTNGDIIIWDGLTSKLITSGINLSNLDSRYVNVTGDTMSGNLGISGLLGLSGYVKLQGDESGLFIRDDAGTDWRDIRARSIIKHLGTGDQYLMANGTVTTTGATTSYYDSRYVNVTGDTMSGELTINNNLKLNGQNFNLGYSGTTFFYVVDEGGPCISIDVPSLKIINNWRTDFDQDVTIKNNIVVDGYIKGNSNSLTGLITDTVVYSISKTSGSAAFIDYVVWNPITLGYRSGTIMSVWDSVNNRIEFTETGTNDLFSTTSDINFSCIINGTNVQLIADITGGTWNIKLGVRIL